MKPSRLQKQFDAMMDRDLLAEMEWITPRLTAVVEAQKKTSGAVPVYDAGGGTTLTAEECAALEGA